MNIKIINTILVVSISISAFSQHSEIKNTIDQLFEGMRLTDSTLIKGVFDKDAKLSTVYDLDKRARLKSTSIKTFVTTAGTTHDGVWNEKVLSYEIKVDGILATVWTPYEFYVDSTFIHCGVNAFTLIKPADKWLITSIVDTRRTINCKNTAIDSLDITALMNNWHYAAATADEDVFFGSMLEEAIYLGTDKSEKWFRDELKEWSAKYFESDKAWDFTPLSRSIYFSKDKQIAWFDEQLETWMGICRGSGIVVKKDGSWKIAHYNLSVTVPNEVVKNFITLVEKFEKK
jgi:hypothetical protein